MLVRTVCQIELPVGQFIKKFTEFGGERCAELLELLSSRMAESQLFRVEKLTTKLRDATANHWIADRFVAASSVSFVTDDGEFQPGEMDANLVGPTRLQLDIKDRKAIKSLPYPIQGQGRAPAADNRHARAMPWIARDWLIDLSAALSGLPMH